MRTIEEIFKQIESVPDFAGHSIDSVAYRNGYGDTPLHIVSNWGDCEAIEILVAAGADINAQGETGFSPLHCAAEQNHPKAACLLIELGAKLIENEDGESPLELAENLGNEKAVNAIHKNI